MPVNLLGAFAVAVGDRLSAAMEGTGRWTLSVAAALNVLADRPGLSVDELAVAIGLSQSATVRLVDRMERALLVQRRPSGLGRRLALQLTADGQEQARQAQEARTAGLAEALASLPEDRRAGLLAGITDLLEAWLPDAAAAGRACRLCDQRRCLAAGCPLPR